MYKENNKSEIDNRKSAIEKHPAAREAYAMMSHIVLTPGGPGQALHVLENLEDEKLRQCCLETFQKVMDPLPREISDLEIIALEYILHRRLVGLMKSAILEVQKANGCRFSDCDLSAFEKLGLLLSEVENDDLENLEKAPEA